jgi:hypothetical protein
MSFDSKVLGQRYFDLDAAKVDKSPSEIVVTDNDETYYIINRDVYDNGPFQMGYKIVVNEGE